MGTKGVFPSARRVKLSPYYIAKTEVTYSLWYEVKDWARANGYVFSDSAYDVIPPSGNDKHPVSGVSWQDCIVWCNAYTEMTLGENDCVYRTSDGNNSIIRNIAYATGRNLSISRMKKNMKLKGFRLPTEAEWEFAARYEKGRTHNYDKVAVDYGSVWLTRLTHMSGAKKSCFARQDSKPVAWFDSNCRMSPTGYPISSEVATRPRSNSLGIYDMSGNVEEWCFDFVRGMQDKNPTVYDYEYMQGDSVVDPLGLPYGDCHVVRGGSYDSCSKYCAVGYRCSRPFDLRMPTLGFRLAATQGN